MTATETVACRRCHGTGHEPQPPAPTQQTAVSAEQREILDRLAQLGAERAGANRHTLSGRRALDDAYREIRVAAAEGDRVGLSRVQMFRAIGVSRTAFYNIINGDTGTS